MKGYVYDQAWERERERLAGIEALWDESTTSALARLGTAPGWRCLEVGAGGGSIAAWLCERVTPGGRVVATDLDTRFLERLEHPALEVRRHDVTAEPLEEGAFDLVHCRMLLEHLPARAEALSRMAAAVAPGGLLLVEDYDMVSAAPVGGGDLEPLFARIQTAVIGMMVGAGYDPYFGRRLAGELSARGFSDVGSEGHVHVLDGRHPGAAFYRLTLEATRERIVALGDVTNEEVDLAIGAYDDPAFRVMTPILVAAWGRRPA